MNGFTLHNIATLPTSSHVNHKHVQLVALFHLQRHLTLTSKLLRTKSVSAKPVCHLWSVLPHCGCGCCTTVESTESLSVVAECSSGDVASRRTAFGGECACVVSISGSVLHGLDSGLGNGSTLKPMGCVMGKRGSIPSERGFIDLLACTRGYFELGRRPRGTFVFCRMLSMQNGLWLIGEQLFSTHGSTAFARTPPPSSSLPMTPSSPMTSISKSSLLSW